MAGMICSNNFFGHRCAGRVRECESVSYLSKFSTKVARARAHTLPVTIMLLTHRTPLWQPRALYGFGDVQLHLEWMISPVNDA
jgi:hypothetical protein